jgi:hypothetical protein
MKVGFIPIQKSGSETTMWIIVRTRKQKNSFLNSDGEWTRDRKQAETFDQFDFAVSYRDRLVSPRERRGVGVVKLEAEHAR